MKNIILQILVLLLSNKILRNIFLIIYKIISKTSAQPLLNKIVKSVFTYYWVKTSKKYQKTKLEKPRLFWGTTPIINNKYWSESMKGIGFDSKTLMSSFYVINKKEDYDMYFEDILKKYYDKYSYSLVVNFKKFFLFDFILKNFDIYHLPFTGTGLFDVQYFDEGYYIKIFGGKIVILPYGSDFQQYSKIINISFRHSLLINYPNGSKTENKTLKNVLYWTQNADIIISGFAIDNIGRWDVFIYNYLFIDTKQWKFTKKNTNFDGVNGAVSITHTPNHRGIKGTEFIIKAIEDLRNEGLKIELILLEKLQNDEVRDILENKTDILVEQLIYGAYALSAIEGMASGLPVLSNLDVEEYTQVFRRYSYLNECPILSTTPETIKDNLRILVKNPKLREELGRVGRKYVEKYHSYQTSQYMFGKIYDKIWYEKDIDLMNMFHPIMPDSYNNQSPKIEHPLIENKIPESLLTTLNK